MTDLADALAGVGPELHAEHLLKGILAFTVGYLLGWLIIAEVAAAVRVVMALAGA